VQRSRWWIGAAAIVVLGLTVGVAVAVGATPYKQLGNSGNGDPGAAVRFALPLLRATADAAGSLCVGSLAFAILFSRPDTFDGEAGLLAGRGYRAVRRGAVSAGVWGVAAGGVTVCSALADAGLRPSQVPNLRDWWTLISVQQESLGWFISTIAAFCIALTALLIERWQSAALVTIIAVAALLPPLFGGHSSSEAGHDYATAAIMIHVLAAALWIGLLVCVLMEAARPGKSIAGVLSRYSRVAWWCLVAVVGSGLIDAGVLDPGFRFTTQYGRMLAITVVATAAAAAFGGTMRRRAIRAVGSSDRRAVVTVCGAELVLLATAFGSSVELSQLAPPVFQRTIPVSLQNTMLGYNLSQRPTLSRLAFDWRVEVFFAALAACAAACYGVGVVRVGRRREPWPWTRTLAWLAGCGVVLVATSSGIGRYEPASFSAHMTSQMLLATVAPLFLVLGGPLSLARAASRPTPPGLPGAHDWIGLVDGSALMRAATHPIIALGVFAGAPFFVYFGGIFDQAARFHWAHLALDVFFLAIGYVFAWTVVGVDPLPRPLLPLGRLGMLLIAAPFCAVFAGLVMTTHRILGNGLSAGNEYSALLLSWHPNLLADQRLGGIVALVASDGTLFAALVVLLVRSLGDRDAWWDVDADDGLSNVAAGARGSLPGDSSEQHPAHIQTAGARSIEIP
jgi:putative copper resistance protein D